MLIEKGCVKRVVASYVGENRQLFKRYQEGLVEVELVPQVIPFWQIVLGNLGRKVESRWGGDSCLLHTHWAWHGCGVRKFDCEAGCHVQ